MQQFMAQAAANNILFPTIGESVDPSIPLNNSRSSSRKIHTSSVQSRGNKTSNNHKDLHKSFCSLATVKESYGSQNIPESLNEINDLQRLILSRRTITKFDENMSVEAMEALQRAIERGVECSRYAPNHRRTEPFTFKRMIAPSISTTRLSNICYEYSKLHKDEETATTKMEKWSKIPAWLVATVSGQEDQTVIIEDDDDNDSQYEPLPIVAPRSERQIEDYAATCAAIQNVMLSIHSEGLGSKWATGSVIRTRAFRDLVGAQPDEMIVGLLMIGKVKLQPKPPRKHRALMGDILQDV